MYHFIFKYIIVGDMGVGKSCLLHHFTEKRFLADSPHTLGVEFGTRVCEVHGKTIKLQIWDTAGQERFRAVTRSYYRGAAACILVFDITRRSSFNHISTWLTDARNLTNPNTVLVLVGNKLDLEQNREVSEEEVVRFAEENGLIYVEASAKTGQNVEEVFLRAASQIFINIENGSLDLKSAETGVVYGQSRIAATQKLEPRSSSCCGSSRGSENSLKLPPRPYEPLGETYKKALPAVVPKITANPKVEAEGRQKAHSVTCTPATQRLALCIGNNEYQGTPLSNCVADAEDMGDMLHTMGFDVAVRTNLDRLEMFRALNEFCKRIPSGNDCIGVIFFSGHGVARHGMNYLVPIHNPTDIHHAEDVDLVYLPLDTVIKKLNSYGGATFCIFLDCCRDLALHGGGEQSKSVFAKTGLSGKIEIKSPASGERKKKTHFAVGFAAAAGCVSYGNQGHRNSQYTTALLRYLPQKQDLALLHRQIADAVSDQTEGKQEPWLYESLSGRAGGLFVL